MRTGRLPLFMGRGAYKRPALERSSRIITDRCLLASHHFKV